MSHAITLPSGLAGRIRGLKVQEANLLANQAEQRRGSPLDGVYAAVWEATTNLGPYASVADAVDPKTGLVLWNKVLVADRFSLTLAVRIATYGAEYSFPVRCVDSNCREKFTWELSLQDLPRKDIPASALEAFKNGNRMSATFPGSSQEFWFKLMDGEGEKAAEKLMKQNRARQLTAALASRIVEITGVHPNDKLGWLDQLDLGAANEVLGILDQNDGGVESTIEVECPQCGDVQEMNLPFGKEFWVPSRMRKPGLAKRNDSPNSSDPA